MIKLMIIDDHSMVREGLKQLLELDDDLKVISQASDGFEGLKKIEEDKPDVLLLDINMPNMNGLELLEELKERNIELKVLILTIHNERICIKGFRFKFIEESYLFSISG